MKYEDRMVKNYDSKHYDMSNQQVNIDRQTSNPMNMDNMYDDADHNPHYGIDYPIIINTNNGRSSPKKLSKIKSIFARIKKWFY